jgi:WD40 repeat protein
MKIERPRFELTRIYEDGAREAPEIVPVTEVPWITPMSRRGALGVGIGAAAALFLLEGRGEADSLASRNPQRDNTIKAPEKAAPAHAGQINDLAMTPDGKLLISSSTDNTVKLWSMPEGRWLTTLPAHPDNVSDLAVTPDGGMLITACGDALRLWSLPEGRLLALMDEHTDAINAIAITPDGRTLISSGDDKTIRFWSLPEGRLLATLEGLNSPTHFLAVAPNGKRLVSGGKNSRLRLWSLPERRLLTRLDGNYAACAIAPDSRAMIAHGSSDIELRSLEDGRLLSTVKVGYDVHSLAVSPDGKLLVAASRENVRLWSLPEGTLLRTAQPGSYNPLRFAFSADGRMLLAWAEYDSPRLWSLPDLQLTARLQADSNMRAARFTPDGRQLLTGQSSGSLAFWNAQPIAFQSYLFDPVFTASKPPDKTIRAHKEGITALAISPDGKTLASASHDNLTKLWSLPGGQLLATLEGHKEGVNDIAITPDSKTYITAGNDKTIKLWSAPDTPSAPVAAPSKKSAKQAAPQKTSKAAPQKAAPKGRLLATLEGHQSGVRKLLLSVDGKTLVSIDQSHAVKTWLLPEGRLLGALAEQKGEMLDAAITPDGKLLVTASNERDTRNNRNNYAVKLWSLPEGQPLATLNAVEGEVQSLAIAPDGKLLAMSAGDYAISLWELPSGRLIGSFEQKESSTRALTFAPDGKLLAAGMRDNSIELWSLPEGRMLARLEENRRENYGRERASLTFTPNGQRLLSSTRYDSVKLWSAPEGRLLATFETQMNSTEAMAITPDSLTLACGDSSGGISLWDLEKPGFRTFLFDAAANTSEVKGITYNVYDKVTGQTVTYTLPCGSPIPPGAVCVCNCVPGTSRGYDPPPYRPSRGGWGGGGGTICMCNRVCTCIPISDRNVKEAFHSIDPLSILDRLSELPITTWNYKWDDNSVRHIGPMAQDFVAAFGVGEDDKHICPVDAQGVAFAAIQGLYRIAREKEAQLDNQRRITESLREQLRAQQKENNEMKARIEALERLMKSQMRLRDGSE